MKKWNYSIYPNSDPSKFDIYAAPLGHVATVHSFDVAEGGIISEYKYTDSEQLRKAWKEYYTKLQEQLKQLRNNQGS